MLLPQPEPPITATISPRIDGEREPVQRNRAVGIGFGQSSIASMPLRSLPAAGIDVDPAQEGRADGDDQASLSLPSTAKARMAATI